MTRTLVNSAIVNCIVLCRPPTTSLRPNPQLTSQSLHSKMPIPLIKRIQSIPLISLMRDWWLMKDWLALCINWVSLSRWRREEAMNIALWLRSLLIRIFLSLIITMIVSYHLAGLGSIFLPKGRCVEILHWMAVYMVAQRQLRNRSKRILLILSVVGCWI